MTSFTVSNGKSFKMPYFHQAEGTLPKHLFPDSAPSAPFFMTSSNDSGPAIFFVTSCTEAQNVMIIAVAVFFNKNKSNPILVKMVSTHRLEAKRLALLN